MKHATLDLHALTAEFGPLSAYERRMLVLGIRGADGDDALPLTDLLDRVAHVEDLADADLATLEGDLLAAVDLLAEEARATSDDGVLANLTAAATAVTAVREAAASRIAHAEEVAQQVEATLASLNPAEPDDDAEPEVEGEPETEPAMADAPPATEAAADTTPSGDASHADPEAGDAGPAAEPIAASAEPPRVGRVAARRPQHTTPRARPAERDVRTVLRASANVPGMPPGQVLDTPERVHHAVDAALRATAGYQGPRTQIPLFNLGVFDPSEMYGEDRTLRDSARGNERKIKALTSREALRASGGICAPPPIQYDLPIIGDDARPVRDSLARFGADRGGVRLLPPPLITDLTGAIDDWTEANDITPSDPATKPCLVLDCPSEVETLVDAITRCLKIGNYRARFFPEQVQAWVTLAGVAYARHAEARMIAKMFSESTQVTATQVLGTTRDLLAVLDRAGAQYRDRHRISPDAPLRLIAPAWLLDNMITDLAREMPGATAERLATSDATIQSFLTARQINVAWRRDSETGATFGAQGDGVLLPWPSTVELLLFAEGEWLFLDGGTLDFGLVRDSTLNATNDFMLFSEGFEQVAFHGTESQKITLDICASGETADGVDTSGVCTSGS